MKQKSGIFLLLCAFISSSFATNNCIQDIEKHVKKERSGRGNPYEYVLHLNSCGLIDEDMPEVVAFLQENDEIYHLDVSNNMLTWKTAQILVDSELNLSQLDISENNLEEQGAVILSQFGASIASEYMTSLDVSKNNLNDKAGEALARNTTFSMMSLNKNQIGDDALIAFSHNTVVEILHLGYNQITDAGVIEFANITRLVRSRDIFTTLNLSFNHIGTAGIGELNALKADRLVGNLWVEGNAQ